MKHDEAVETMAAERYILGELSQTETDIFEAHFFECAECASDVRILSQLKEGVRGVAVAPAAAAAPRVERKASWRDRWSLWWFTPGIAFASIGVLAMTASLMSWQYMQLRQISEPQTVASIMLRPETRGAIAQFDVHGTKEFALLEADLPGATGALKWKVTSENATDPIAEGSGTAPESGASFKILVPSRMLRAGSYVVQVRSADGVRSWTFRFSTSGT